MQLEDHLKDVPKGTHQRDEYFALGIREVATGIAFLNNAVGLVHGAIGLSSIVVTENLEWKIAGFDLVSELNEIGRGVNGRRLSCMARIWFQISINRTSIAEAIGSPFRKGRRGPSTRGGWDV